MPSLYSSGAVWKNYEFSCQKYKISSWERGFATGISGINVLHFRSSVIEAARLSSTILSVDVECMWYIVKKVNGFPVPSRDIIYQTLPGRE
jgi:hypothetical protein